MTRPFDGDGPGATTVIKAGGHLVNKLPSGYTSIPLATCIPLVKQAPQ